MNNIKIENILKTLQILYIDSDVKFIKNISSALEMSSNKLFVSMDIKESALIYNENNIDIIIIDTIVNNKESIEFIKKIRNLNTDICIIVLSSVSNIELLEKLIPLNLISLIKKPIDLILLKDALYLCANDILKRGMYEINFCNGATYNINKKYLYDNNKEIELSYHEILFLDSLISNRHQVLSGEVYKDMIWNDSYDKSDSALKSLLNRLRNKIGKNSIKTVSGYGYRLILQND